MLTNNIQARWHISRSVAHSANGLIKKGQLTIMQKSVERDHCMCSLHKSQSKIELSTKNYLNKTSSAYLPYKILGCLVSLHACPCW